MHRSTDICLTLAEDRAAHTSRCADRQGVYRTPSYSLANYKNLQ